jgi:hypothetical protein
MKEKIFIGKNKKPQITNHQMDSDLCCGTKLILLLHSKFFKFLCLVWCPGQTKRIAPLSFFHGCRKRRLKD